MKRLIPAFCMCILLFGCKEDQPKIYVSEREKEAWEATDPKIPETKYYNFDYTYPVNVFKGDRFRDSDIEFYPIGISDEGLLAYEYRPCDGGCGCCIQRIEVMNLTTDKVVKELDLNPEHDENLDHRQNWSSNRQKISGFLKKYRISQVPLPIINNPIIDFDSYRYKVMVSTRKGSDNDEYLGYGTLKYTVRVKMDDGKSKVVSRGEFSDGVAFKYLGYIKSPYAGQVALLFLKSYDGWEAEHMNRVVVVGCKLGPKYF